MALITLLGKTHAEVGSEFYFIGPLTECKDCRLKGVCFNLEPGAKYRVTEVRSQEHECHEFYGDSVTAVVVEKIVTPAAIPKKQAMGSSVVFESRKCDNIGCENWQFCCPSNARNGDRFSIADDLSDIKCPIGEQLRLVKLE